MRHNEMCLILVFLIVKYTKFDEPKFFMVTSIEAHDLSVRMNNTNENRREKNWDEFVWID